MKNIKQGAQSNKKKQKHDCFRSDGFRRVRLGHSRAKIEHFLSFSVAYIPPPAFFFSSHANFVFFPRSSRLPKRLPSLLRRQGLRQIQKKKEKEEEKDWLTKADREKEEQK